MIIGAAITITVMKTVNKFSRKRKKKRINFKNESFQMEHNCSDCSADCMLRDAINTPVNAKNDSLCKKIEIKSK